MSVALACLRRPYKAFANIECTLNLRFMLSSKAKLKCIPSSSSPKWVCFVRAVQLMVFLYSFADGYAKSDRIATHTHPQHAYDFHRGLT